MNRFIAVVILGLSLSLQASAPDPATNPILPRPPQFVMFAFDGGLDLAFWESSLNFVSEMKKEETPVQFTYFLSGTYFVSDALKNKYYAPHHGYGQAAIDFGGSVNSIPQRLAEVNKAYAGGNELGSHAVCHFDGGEGKWSLADWTQEFTQFWHFIFDALSVNGVKALTNQPLKGYLFDQTEVIGYRAPYLSTNDAMYTALKNFGFKYDTSQDNDPTYWPTKNKVGLWNFPLADLKIVGTGKKTLSMDYNFYVAQSGGKDDLAHKDIYKQQMIDTYLKYFQENYNGNRAPINIGHHFYNYNGGVYWQAMQDVAKKVCGLPDVRCVTYTTYMKWLESLSPEVLAEYRNGKFQKAPALHLTDAQPLPTVPLKLVQKPDGSLMAQVQVQDLSELQNYTAYFTVHDTPIYKTEIALEDVRGLATKGENVAITVHLISRETEIEVQRATQKLMGVGTPLESLDSQILEDRSMLGDLPEAHQSR